MTDCTWIIHGVSDDCECCEGTHTGRPLVYHTHGLAEFNGGLELELQLPLAGDSAMMILNTIGFALAEGKVVLADGLQEKTLFSMPLRYVLVKAADGAEDEEILRVILPDPAGLFPEDVGVDSGYGAQLLPGERLTELVYHGNSC